MSDTKVCKHCKLEKNVLEYNKAGGGKWLQIYRKPCDSIRKKEYGIKNKDLVSASRDRYYKQNRDKILNKDKEKRKLIPKKERVYNKMPIEERKEKVSAIEGIEKKIKNL